MTTLRGKALAVAAGVTSPFAFAVNAHADASSCDWWVDAKPLCMVVEGSINKVVIKNFNYGTGRGLKLVRLAALDAGGGRRWVSRTWLMQPDTTVTACSKSDGAGIFASTDGKPCHVWPNGYRLRLEEWYDTRAGSDPWRKSSAPDVDIKK